MKITKTALFTFGMMLVPLVAFADELPMASIDVPAGSPWYATIIAAIFPILLGFLTWLSGRVSSFAATKMEEAKTAEQGKWYSAAFGLAAIAVKAAETFYGPDSGKGKEKKAMAAQWLVDRLVAMDPSILKKNPNIQKLVEGLVDAAYHDVFKALAPLGPAVATLPSTPSGSATKSLSGNW